MASGVPPPQWAKHFDTVNVCFSKGLGAPVGSALAGPKELVREAVRHRKVFGGGMRQAGILAAAALYALDITSSGWPTTMSTPGAWPRAWGKFPAYVSSRRRSIRTSSIFTCRPGPLTAVELVARLACRGILMHETSPCTIRAVTHLDVNADDVQQAIQAVAAQLGNC